MKGTPVRTYIPPGQSRLWYQACFLWGAFRYHLYSVFYQIPLGVRDAVPFSEWLGVDLLERIECAVVDALIRNKEMSQRDLHNSIREHFGRRLSAPLLCLAIDSMVESREVLERPEVIVSPEGEPLVIYVTNLHYRLNDQGGMRKKVEEQEPSLRAGGRLLPLRVYPIRLSS